METRRTGSAFTRSHDARIKERARTSRERGHGPIRESPAARCEYCGKELVVQSEQLEHSDGNLVILEPDGSRKRVCRSCADGMSWSPRNQPPLGQPQVRF